MRLGEPYAQAFLAAPHSKLPTPAIHGLQAAWFEYWGELQGRSWETPAARLGAVKAKCRAVLGAGALTGWLHPEPLP